MKTRQMLLILAMLLMTLSVHAVTTVINYELNDSYGDGWNGASISVVDAETGQEWASLTIDSGESSVGSFMLVSGRTYHFIWKSGSYDDECSFKFTDVKGNVFLKHRVGSSYGDGKLLTYVAFMKGDVNSDGKVSIADVMDEVKYVVNDGGAEQPEPDENVEIRYELRDSYGDGWNGASLHVFDTGIWDYVGELTIDEGYSNSGTITLTAGHTYSFEWFPGSYDDECSFSLYDSAGEELFSWSGGDIPIEEVPLRGTVLERETIASVKLQKVVPSVKVAKEKTSKPSRIRKEPAHGDLLFEYTPEAGTSTTVSSPRDLNDDGNINISDVMVLVKYVSNGIPIPDLELSSESLEVFTYNNATIEIVSGSGFFEAISSNPDNLGVTLSGMTITVKSKVVGSFVVTVKDLESNKTKEVQVVVKEPQLSCPDNHHPHMIDLGLPSGTKWACCNVDATTPEGFGAYYAWGEIVEKSDYSWATYTHCDGTEGSCQDLGTSISGTKHDVAHYKWGGNWYMPMSNQYGELFSRCPDWLYTSINGVTGLLLTAPNGNNIFLPCGGWKDGTEYFETNPQAIGHPHYAFFWLGDSYGNDSQASHSCVVFHEVGNSGVDYWRGASRHLGYNVRPVSIDTAPLSLSASKVEIAKDENTTVEVTSGCGSYTAESNNANVATATVEGSTVTITAVRGGTATITITDTQSGKKVSVTVSVQAIETSSACPDDNHPHMIDLGLPSGTKWACCNVGADTPEAYGGYYAWGETQEKNYYDYDNYEFFERFEHLEDGPLEYDLPIYTDLGRDIAGTKYDVAQTEWGESWVMPSWDQMEELYEKCASEWTTVNGIYGVKFTSNFNGSSIFMPAAGSCEGQDFQGRGSNGYYWSSTQAVDESVYYANKHGNSLLTPANLAPEKPRFAMAFPTVFEAYYLPFDSRLDWSLIAFSIENRQYGQSVRPVSSASSVPSLCPDNNHPHMIDLGLPSGTKWACCNVDTDYPENQSPANFGGYYAWGETETKTTYDWSSYIHCDGTLETVQDLDLDIAGTQYDVAHVKWGGSWQMPTKDQFYELINNCEHEWTTEHGVNGMMFKSNGNGGTIFLPAAGYRTATALLYAGNLSDYWSSSVCTSTVPWYDAWDFVGDGCAGNLRDRGRTVRPISAASSAPHLQLSFTGVHEPIMWDEEFTVDILSGSGSYTVKSDDMYAVSVYLDGTTIFIHGMDSGYAIITVTDTQTGETASFEVNVYPPAPPFSLSEESLILAVGETEKVYPYDGNDDYTWKSSDESVATVEYIEYEEEDPNGGPSLYEYYFLITAVGLGTATITVTDEWSGETAIVEVTVTDRHEINRSHRPVSSNNH